jgi:hypothetical protein
VNVRLSSPANTALVRYLKSRAASAEAVSVASHLESASPKSIDDPYYSLGAHPDLLGWFWDELTVKLPGKYQWVVYGTLVLVHPAAGVIFGFAGGTHTYALRLPPGERVLALQAGCKRVWNYPAYPELNLAASTLDLKEIGEEWVFGQLQAHERDWCLAAFQFAGQVAEDLPNS